MACFVTALHRKSMHQRADALIGLAHTGFRDELANSLW